MQQLAHADEAGRGGAQHRHDEVVVQPAVKYAAELVFGQLFIAEVLLHERFVGFDDPLDELRAQAHGFFAEVFRHLGLLGPLANVRAHVQQVHDALERGVGANRELQGPDPRAPPLAESVQGFREIRVLAVHAVHHNQPRESGLVGGGPRPRRPELGTVDGIDDDDGEVRRPRPAGDLTGELGITRRVQDVDLAALPLHRYDREAEAEAPLPLILVVIAQRVLLLHGAKAGDCASLERCSFGQRGLPDAPVAQEDDVADIARAVDIHRRHPPIE